jgi:hypothetical protein
MGYIFVIEESMSGAQGKRKVLIFFSIEFQPATHTLFNHKNIAHHNTLQNSIGSLAAKPSAGLPNSPFSHRHNGRLRFSTHPRMVHYCRLSRIGLANQKLYGFDYRQHPALAQPCASLIFCIEPFRLPGVRPQVEAEYGVTLWQASAQASNTVR